MDTQFVVPFADVGRSFVSLMFDSGPFAKVVLLLLFVMSVATWAIIFDRTRLYLKLKKGGDTLHAGITSKGLALPMETVKRSLPSIEGALIMETKRYVEGKNASSSGGAAGGGWANQLKDLLDGVIGGQRQSVVRADNSALGAHKIEPLFDVALDAV